MIRTRHDEWVKRALSLWLGQLGDVRLDARIAGETRHGDVLYTERRGRPARRRKLGALGELARGRVLFEPFRNPVTAIEVRSCVLKVIDLEAQEARAARRAKRKLSTEDGAMLCVITPTMSSGIATEVGATRMRSDTRGMYELAAIWRTGIVVVHELPRDPSTLWLRLLGRGKVQAAAVKELLEKSRRDPLRDATLRLLVAWQQTLPPPAERSDDERELAMNLDRIYDRWERKTLAKGEAKGEAKALLAMLEGRGLTVTAAQRRQVLACTDDAQLMAWARAAGTTPSVEALLSGTPRRPRAK